MRTSSKLGIVVCLLSMVASSCLAQSCEDALAVANKFRRMHQAPNLRWDTNFAREARAWADQIASNGCTMKSAGVPMALFGGSTDCSAAINNWYNSGATKYKFAASPWSANVDQFRQVGVFMQLVWNSASAMGCGFATSKCGAIVACRFDAGIMNNDASVRSNVLRPGSGPVDPGPISGPKAPAGCQNSLAQQNQFRQLHGARPLQWDINLVRRAEPIAKRLADNGCRLLAEVPRQLEFTISNPGSTSQCLSAVNDWYSGNSQYSFNEKPWTSNKGNLKEVGSFMNLVWASASRVGCAEARGSNCAVVVCNFDKGVSGSDKAVSDNVRRKGDSSSNTNTNQGADSDPDCGDYAKAGWCLPNFGFNGKAIIDMCPKSCASAPKSIVARRLMAHIPTPLPLA